MTTGGFLGCKKSNDPTHGSLKPILSEVRWVETYVALVVSVLWNRLSVVLVSVL